MIPPGIAVVGASDWGRDVIKPFYVAQRAALRPVHRSMRGGGVLVEIE
jgi:hypothetical protein